MTLSPKRSFYGLEEYKSKKIKTGLANKTINCHLVVLSKSLGCAEEWYGLERIPKIKWLKCPPVKNEFLTHEECNQLLNHAKDKWHEMILIALRTGLRLGELRALRWEDINWNTRILTVQRSYSRGKIDSTKSNKNRYIPIHKDVCAILKKRQQRNGFIFTNKAGRLLSNGKLYRALKRSCKNAGIRRIGWHLFRHTFASHLAIAGASMKAIQELLGHSDIQTTMRYAHFSPSALNSTIDLLGANPQNNFGQYMASKEHDFDKILKLMLNHNPEIFAKVKQKQPPKKLGFYA